MSGCRYVTEVALFLVYALSLLPALLGSPVPQHPRLPRSPDSGLPVHQIPAYPPPRSLGSLFTGSPVPLFYSPVPLLPCSPVPCSGVPRFPWFPGPPASGSQASLPLHWRPTSFTPCAYYTGFAVPVLPVPRFPRSLLPRAVPALRSLVPNIRQAVSPLHLFPGSGAPGFPGSRFTDSLCLQSDCLQAPLPCYPGPRALLPGPRAPGSPGPLDPRPAPSRTERGRGYRRAHGFTFPRALSKMPPWTPHCKYSSQPVAPIAPPRSSVPSAICHGSFRICHLSSFGV